MKTTFTRIATLIMLLFLLPGIRNANAQTLSQGDVSFVGFNSNLANRDGFAFVTWVNISSGTTIKFTDDGFNSSSASNASGNLRDFEQTATWTATSTVPAGTVITIEGNGSNPQMVANIGSVSVVNSDGTTATNLNLGNGGDQVVIHQTTYTSGNTSAATLNAPALYAISWQGISSTFTNWLSSGTTASATSYLPSDLSSYNLFFNGSAYAAEYTGPRTGLTIAQYKAAVNTLSNWTTYTSGGVTTYNTTVFSTGTPAAITGQPSSSTICSNGNTSFTVSASNVSSFAWEVSTNGGTSYSTVTAGGVYSISSTTGTTGSTTLTIIGALANMNGYMYHAIATGSSGSPATSNAATLTVNTPPSISSQPAASSICAGANTSFSAAASNATTYQWQVNTGSGFTNITNGGVYSGATTTTLTITGATAGMNGYTYLLVASGSCSPAYSTSAALTVNSAPSISGQPSASTICAGNNTTFSVTASNATGYQWQVDAGSGFTSLSNGAPYSGVTTATLTITSATAALNGYSYRVVVTGACTPAATSNGASLTVNSAPSVSGQPSSASACLNSNVSFSATVSNATGYQWQENTGSGFSNITNGGVYSGANTATLTITGATAGMNGYQYRLVATGACTPNATSNAATLTVSTANTWTGNSTIAWNNTANWGCGTLPTATTDVIIPNVTNLPVVNITNAAVKNLTINSGASLGFITNSVLNVNGNITNNGTLNTNAGKIVLSGSAQSMPGNAYTNLEINGSGTKTLTGAASVSGTFTLTSGYLQLGSNNLTLGSSAVISGGSASSYVITNSTGKLVNQNIGASGKTGTIVFPVGSNSLSYTPATLINTGTADAFSVNVYDNIYSSYSNDLPNSAPQSIDAVAKTWIVSEAVAGGSNATLTLQWNGIDQLTGFDKNNCYLLHYNNATNQYAIGPMGVAGGSDPYTQSWSGLTSFSPFGVGSIGSPLDVQLISFTFAGKSNGDLTQLQWVTANERNMTQYEVQRSLDAVNFTGIGAIKAANNNGTGTHTYSYTDAGATADRNYYRLKMDQQDGTFRYSNIISVDRKETSANTFHIFPNPVDGDDLFIKTDGDLFGTQVQVTDMQGRVLVNTTPAGWQGKTASLNVKQLPAGIYILRLSNNNGQSDIIRFTKK